MNPAMNFSKGDILFGRKGSDAEHPIIFLNHRDNDFFIGAMITKSGKYAQNILMKPDHFREVDDQGNKFELYYNKSKLVKAKLIKRNEWHPFRKIGELTIEGLTFVENNIEIVQEKLWEEFLNDEYASNQKQQ